MDSELTVIFTTESNTHTKVLDMDSPDWDIRSDLLRWFETFNINVAPFVEIEFSFNQYYNQSDYIGLGIWFIFERVEDVLLFKLTWC